MRTRAPRTLAALVTATALTACGSTVAVDGGVVAAGQVVVAEDGTVATEAGDGLAFVPPSSTTPGSGSGAVTSTGGARTGTTTSGGTTSGGTTSTGGTSGGSSGSPGTTTPGTTPDPGGDGGGDPGDPAPDPQPTDGTQPPPATTGKTAPGVTADEIVIGIAIADDSSPGNSELLGVDISTGDVERFYEIVRDEVNANGGIAGRDVRYSIFRYSTAGGAQISQLEQQACEYWARDDRAFVVNLTTSANFLGCANDNGLVNVNSTLSASDDRTFTEFPFHVEASAMSLTRQQPNLVAGLEQQGWFGPRPGQVVAPGQPAYVLGTVMWDAPPFVRAFEDSWLPALAARNIPFDDANQARIRPLESNEDLAEISAQMQSAVLRFSANGVTNVNFVEDSALLFLLFARSAENQGYRPRYGLTSQSGNTTIGRTLADAGSGEQMRDALGIGWIPAFDVPADERPVTPAAKGCLDLMAREGAASDEDNVRANQLGACEYVGLVKAAVEAGLPDITRESFIAGIDRLGTSFGSYGSLETNAFGPEPTRHAGAHSWRPVAWDPDCVCFHYTGNAVSDLQRR